MINLEQVKLLETKVARAIEYIERLTRENAGLYQKEAEQQTKLEAYQKRIDELEVLVVRFREDQGRIEEAILAALDRLNQFEEAVEKSLWDKPDGVQPAGVQAAGRTGRSKSHPAAQQLQAETGVPDDAADSGGEKICFEIPASDTDDDIPDPLEPLDNDDSSPEKNGELDIF